MMLLTSLTSGPLREPCSKRQRPGPYKRLAPISSARYSEARIDNDRIVIVGF